MIENYNFFLLIVYALATWRVANLLVDEEGPYAVLIRLRTLLGVKYLVVGEPDPDLEYITDNFENWRSDDELHYTAYKNEIAKAISCIWCTSVWISFIFIFCEASFAAYALDFVHGFALWMAVSALAIKISEV